MVKFLYPTKNNKASILPVTVIAMFIMMIVAYACIKMFLVQNIVITQDQIKTRTFYAATGIAKKQIMRLKAAIDVINQDPNIEITEDTVFDETGIKNLSKKNGSTYSNYNFLFADVLNQTAAQDPDVVPGQNFFTAKGINGSSGTYTDSMLENVKMYPPIQCSVFTINSFDPPESFYKDIGVAFYKTKGVNITKSDLHYDNYMNINSSIYPNIGNDDPRKTNSPNPAYGNPSAYNYNNFGNEFVEYYGNTVGSYMSYPGKPSAPAGHQKLFYRVPLQTDGVTTVANTLNTVKDRFVSLFPLGNPDNWTAITNDFGAPDNTLILRITAWHVTYKVKNIKKGYWLYVQTKTPAIGNKIDEMTGQVRIYFELFMTKLYRRYDCITSNNKNVWYLRRNSNWMWTGTPTGWTDGLSNAVDGEVFCKDESRTINNIKFRIAKSVIAN